MIGQCLAKHPRRSQRPTHLADARRRIAYAISNRVTELIGNLEANSSAKLNEVLSVAVNTGV